MSIEVRSVSSRWDLRRFINFGYELYKDCPYAVPALYVDEIDTLSSRRNPAYGFCEAELFLVYRDGRIVGRVAAIINNNVNARWNQKAVRFGWLDFIDDQEVSSALLDRVAQWGRERGMESIHGPLGFTDFDREGILVEGFDQMATMSTTYNYPYYIEHLARLGFEKELGWIEMRLKVPEKAADRHIRMCEAVLKRYNLHIVHYGRARDLCRNYGEAFFSLINEGYSDLAGFSELTDAQKNLYISKYLKFIDHRMVCLIANEEGRLIAGGVSMPSLSVALQKSRGRLFPLGWWYILRALFWKYPDTLDLLLIAVTKEYRNKGITAIMLGELIPNYIKMGFKWGETTLELESNSNIQAMWEMYDHRIHKRHSLFTKKL